MRFDLFVCTMAKGETFKRAVVEDAFAPYVREARLGSLYFGDATSGLFLSTLAIEEAESIDRFSINRPPRYGQCPEFWCALFDVLRQTPTVLVWPAPKPFPCLCIANAAVAGRLPPGLIADFGAPMLVSSGAAIGAAVAAIPAMQSTCL
jgi:hypothetical protein